jgi:type I restriction enzyme M protein
MTAGTQSAAADAQPTAIIVQQGKLLDFIDGLTQRPETPEEYVRQEIAKSLVREYRYPKTSIAVGVRHPRHPGLIPLRAGGELAVPCL